MNGQIAKMNSIEWDDVRLMLAIHRAGTLTGAAGLTGLSQPTLSRRLRSMEKSLGQKVFQRTGSGFALTDEGLLLLPHALRAEEAFLAMERQLQGAGTELQGQIRVASSDWFGARVLSRWIAEFRRIHPRVAVELLTDSRQISLTHREADIAFRIAPFNEAGVIQRHFSKMPYGLYCAASMPCAFNSSVHARARGSGPVAGGYLGTAGRVARYLALLRAGPAVSWRLFWTPR